MPLVTAEQINNELTSLIEGSGLPLREVFNEFPSDTSQIGEGFYVARIYQAEKETVTQTMGRGGLYRVVDYIQIQMINTQHDPNVSDYLNLFANFSDNEIFKQYAYREYTIDQEFDGNSERYLVTLKMTRFQYS